MACTSPVHVVSLQDEVMIVEQVLESLNIKVDLVALFLSGGPMQLSAHEGFAEEVGASVWSIGVAVSSRNLSS